MEKSSSTSSEICLIARLFQVCWEAQLVLSKQQAKLLNYTIFPQLQNSLII